MHVPLFDKGPVIVSAVVAAATCLHVVCGIYKAGVERYGGRILIFSAVINTGIVALMLLLLGATGLRGALTPAGFHVLDVAAAAFLLILPVRAIWNYAKVPGRITRQSGLTSLGHELAHIRNSDVGFMTWSFAFLHDLKWLLLLSPVVMLASLFSRQEYLPRAAVLYVACLLILWSLTNTVVRSRELLADATVALLIDSGKIARTLDEILLAPSTGLCHSDTGSPDTILRIRNWFMDKAMFSRRAKFWKAITRLLELSFPMHLPVSSRLDAMRDRRPAREYPSVRVQEAFWAGLTLGFLGVLIALVGFWTCKFFLEWQDDMQIVLLSYDCWGSTGPLVAAFIALFFVLPAWSSLRPHVPTGRNVAHLLAHYLYGLVGACCVLPLILLGGWSHIEIRFLLVLSIFWVIFALVVGIGVEIVMLSLWLTVRYEDRHFFVGMAWILYSWGIGLLTILGCLVYGLVLMMTGQALVGGSIIFGLWVGLCIFERIAKDGRASGTDQYMVIAPPPLGIYLEGSAYRRWSPLVGALHMIGFCLVPAGVASVIIHMLACRAVGSIGFPVAAAVLVSLGCGILLILSWRWPRRMRETCRQKICALLDSQTFLQSVISTESTRLINRILHGLQVRANKSAGLGTLMTEKMADLCMLASRCERSGRGILEQARQWAIACETQGGLGVWPHSGPRLSSTYQCLQMLEKTGGIQLSDPSHHVLWILGLRTPDGSFRGPWSYKTRWKDTFSAVASLDILGSNLNRETRAMCLDYVRQTLVSEGIETGQLDAFRYCLAIAETLGGLDEEMANSVGQWLSLEMDRLLLTNVAHNAENIHHAVYAYHILKERGVSLFHSERMDLLADRIAAALEAELASLRI